MKIRRFTVYGLLGRSEPVTGDLNDDLNILTGRNGVGKTTLLKLIWYVVSGNILIALKEINFTRIILLTDEYECTVHKLSGNTCKVELTIEEKHRVIEDITDEDGDTVINAEDVANEELIALGSSVFFPTFRRIEGGFTIASIRKNSAGLGGAFLSGSRTSRAKSDVEEALFALSRTLTNGQHVFVSAISTGDIVALLLNRYTRLSEETNRLQQTTSQDIIATIKSFKQDLQDVKQLDAANHVIDSIKTKIETMEGARERILLPLNAVQTLVNSLFRHSGIRFSPSLNFGDAAHAINSDSLSSGEKQMLSFICYNAFYNNAVIFVDEPELSLHVDWQRQLFTILQGQKTSNQFIVATHSPFIYSKYPDKEICLDSDRGDLEK